MLILIVHLKQVIYAHLTVTKCNGRPAGRGGRRRERPPLGGLHGATRTRVGTPRIRPGLRVRRHPAL